MENQHPIKHETGEIDRRYTINLEYCGYTNPLYIVRFCNEKIGACIDYPKAVFIATNHNAERLSAIKQI